ncbi:MAG TPA: protein kinase, partial [Kofleriaceae bacterium]|nr:protein kinase [Kofleriaceae bacterium]
SPGSTTPGVATVHDFGEQGGTLYMVMEYVAGISFREAMHHGMPPGVAARAIAEACRGVHAAHELRDLSGNLLGVVHRDISPDNLMCGFDGHIKVIDFGIALVKNRQAPVTEFGTVKGKPPYMSPEQVKNEAIDRRSDVFSLAVVLWELLTGMALFEGDSIYAIARSVEHQVIRPPSQVLGCALPLGLDAAVMNALDRDRSRRTQTAAAFAEELEQVIQSAGDETLEAWADRVLADARDAHRAWLASVLAGRDAPRPLGRPTGSVTALAPPIGKASTLIAPIAPAAVPTGDAPPQPGASTHLPAMSDDELDAPPRRSLALPLVLGALVLALVGGGIWYTGRGAAPTPRDAQLADAAVQEPPVDASVDEVIDAAIDVPVRAPIDAGRRPVRAPRDAGRSPVRDAAQPATVALDAAPQGFGALTAKHKGNRYLSVVLDGHVIGPTPMFGQRIPAGTHVVELVDAVSSEVVVKTTVTIVPGGAVTVVEP